MPRAFPQSALTVLSQYWSSRLSQHRPSHQRNGWSSKAQELIVKVMPGAPAPAAGGPIVAQLSNHEFPHRVIEVGRIKCAACALLPRIACIGKRGFAKHFLGFRKPHA